MQNKGINMSSLIKNISSNSILRVAILIFLFFCGRFYYLQGFVGHLKPTAPAFFIFLKDFVLILICLSYFPLRNSAKKTPKTHIIAFIFWLLSLSTILAIHFFAKSLHDWGQHYVRNIFLLFLATPTLYLWSLNKKNYLIDIFFYSGLMNSLAALTQIFFLEDTLLGGQRPLGLVGDPISLNLFMFIFFVALLFKKLPFWLSAALYIMCGYIINISGSLSATAASAIGLASLAVLFRLSRNHKNLIMPFVFLLIGVFIPMKNDYNSVKHKAWVFTWGKLVGYVGTEFHPATLSSEKNLFESMNNGRSKSLEIATEAISMNAPVVAQESKLHRVLKLLFGDFSDPVYSRYDSTPAVLIINWGLGILILFYLTIIIILAKSILTFWRNKNAIPVNQLFAFYCAISITACGFANSIWYRSPINFILLMSLILLLNTSQKKQLNTSQDKK